MPKKDKPVLVTFLSKEKLADGIGNFCEETVKALQIEYYMIGADRLGVASRQLAGKSINPADYNAMLPVAQVIDALRTNLSKYQQESSAELELSLLTAMCGSAKHGATLKAAIRI